jgi:acetyl-CoA synthetase
MGRRRASAVHLYTSGSTGKPKGVQHSTGGYLLWAAQTMKWTFDSSPTTCSGARPTSAGSPATLHHLRPAGLRRHEIVFEGVPTYPDAGRFWKMIPTTRSASSTPRRPPSVR